MTDLNFDLNELLSSANAYDNKGAHQALLGMMNRKEVINVKFFTDKQSYPCAWIESKGVAGFKYQLKSESFKGLLRYLAKGEVTDFDRPYERGNTVKSTRGFSTKHFQNVY